MKTMAMFACLISAFGIGSLNDCLAYAEDTPLIEAARGVVSEFSSGEYGALHARFDATMKAALPEEKLPEMWKSIVAQFGVFQSQGAVRQDKSGGFDIVFVTGQFEKGPMDFRIVFNSERQVAGLFLAPAATGNRPQEPRKPYPYREEEVSYASMEEGIKLAGTLTFPESGGPFPAVLLISGSGAQNRDEEIMGHKLFLVLADYLTRRGIAVLRVDDRGVGGSSAGLPTATTLNYVQDVLGGVSYLKSRKEINPRGIGLIGHSEGGIIAPLAASRSGDVAFIVLMAGSGVSGREIILEQIKLLGKAGGASEQQIAENIKYENMVFDILSETPDNEAAEKRISEALSGYPAGKDAVQGAQMKAALSQWFRHFINYHPRPALEKVKCPVLAIFGEKDLQVSPRQNLPEIESALVAGGNKDFKVVELPGLNHLFQTCKTGSVSEYGQIEETISPVALELVSGWISAHTR